MAKQLEDIRKRNRGYSDFFITTVEAGNINEPDMVTVQGGSSATAGHSALVLKRISNNAVSLVKHKSGTRHREKPEKAITWQQKV